MGPASQAHNTAGYPNPDDDPYRGIGGESSMQSANLSFGFSDLMGNVTGSGSGSLSIDVGYTDPLLPVHHWPAVTSYYSLQLVEEVAQTTIHIASQAGSAMPGLTTPPLSAVQSAGQTAKKYKEIYFQLAQPDLTVSVLSTLNPGNAVTVSGARRQLMTFIANYYMYARAVSKLVPVKACASGAQSLSSLTSTYGLTSDQFAESNANQLAKDIFGTKTPIPVPAYSTFAEKDTAASIADDWTNLITITAQDLLDNNSTLPIRPGVTLATTKQQISVANYVKLKKLKSAKDVKLENLAAEYHTSAGLLAEDNASTTSVLKPGFVFTMDGRTVTVGKPKSTDNLTFHDVQKSFVAMGVHASIADIAVAKQIKRGMFTKDALLTSSHYVAADPDTLASIQIALDLDKLSELTSLNTGTENIFDNGAAVFIGAYPTPPTIDDADTQTLQQFAEQYGCTPALLFSYLKGQESYQFPSTSTLEVPGMLTFQGTPPTSPSPPYTTDVRSYQTSASFAEANRAIQGLIKASVSLTVENKTITTGSDDTWNTIIARFAAQNVDVSISEVLSAVPNTTNIYNSSATGLLPPASIELQADIGDGSGPFAYPVFPLEVSLRLQRPEDLVATEFRTEGKDGPVERGECLIPAPINPHHQPGASNKGLTKFAEQFNAVFPNLRLATGKVSDQTADLWVVPFDASGISSVKVTRGVTVTVTGGSIPRYFALRPLYNKLINKKGLTLQTVSSDGNLAPGTKTTDIVNIDPEVWARRFLADLDLILKPPYSTAIHANASSTLTTLLDAKNSLVNGVADGLAAILDISDPNLSDGLADAKQALKNDLGVSLSKAYATNAVVQYDATIDSTTTANFPHAKLEGTPITGGEGQSLGYSFTNAKTNLSESSSFVSFLMKVDDPDLVKDITISDLFYQYTHLEYDIKPISTGSSTYDSSNWLTFVPPLTQHNCPSKIQADLGKATIPIPLRSYPTMPSFTGQTSHQTHSALPTKHKNKKQVDKALSDAMQWTFGVSYTHEHVAQDEVIMEANFNVQSVGAAWGAEDELDLATELAQYIHVADTLWKMVAYYDDPSKGDATTAVNAATSLSTLIHNVATAWASFWPVGQSLHQDALGEEMSSLPHLTAKFSIEMNYDNSGDKLKSITLTKTEDDSWGPESGIYPYLTYTAPGEEPITINPPTPSNNTLIYTLPANTPSGAVAEITLEWKGLNLVTVQNGQTSLSVARNKDLMTGIPTTESFVYQTGEVKAPSIATPLNEWSDSLDITSLGSTVEEALKAMFKTLFKKNAEDILVTIGLFYGFDIASSKETSQELMTYHPIGLYPNLSLSAPYTKAAQDIKNTLDTWKNNNCPNQQNGSWIFSLSFYSGINSNSKHPLMTLEHIVYHISGT